MDEDDDDDNNVPDLVDGDAEDPTDHASALPASIPDQMDHMADEAGWGPTRVALASTRLQSGEILSALAQRVVPAYPSTAGHPSADMSSLGYAPQFEETPPHCRHAVADLYARLALPHVVCISDIRHLVRGAENDDDYVRAENARRHSYTVQFSMNCICDSAFAEVVRGHWPTDADPGSLSSIEIALVIDCISASVDRRDPPAPIFTRPNHVVSRLYRSLFPTIQLPSEDDLVVVEQAPAAAPRVLSQAAESLVPIATLNATEPAACRFNGFEFDELDCEFTDVTDQAFVYSLPARIFGDSGSNIDCISPVKFEQLCNTRHFDPSIFPFVPLSIKLANNEEERVTLQCLGINIRLVAGSRPIHFRCIVYVRDTGYDIVLSNTTLRQTGLKSFFANPDLWILPFDPSAPEEEEESNPEAIDRTHFTSHSGQSMSNSATTTLAVSIDPAVPLHAGFTSIVDEFSSLWAPLNPSDRIKHPGAVFDLTLRDGYDTTMRKYPPRHIAPHLENLLRNELDDLLALGIIVPCGDSPVAHPIVCATKPRFRLCVDYSVWLNKWTVLLKHPIPSINHILENLSRKKYFAQIDLSKAFHQLTVHPDDRWKLAFTTVFGNFTFVSLPFGPTNGPMKFQQLIESILSGVPDVYPYIDDINIGADTPDELLSILREVFVRLRDANIHCNPKKTKLGFTYCNVLGRIVSQNKIGLTEERTKPVLAIPFPSTRKRMRSFLGQALYFQPYVPYYSVLAAPLNTTVSSKTPYKPTPEVKVAFDKLKHALAHTTSLAPLDYSLPILVRCDASIVGIGGGIWNRLADGSLRLCVLISKAFSAVARRWKTIEQECYGIYYVVSSNERLLFGVEFCLQTDHRNLLWLHQSTLPKLIRWRLYLQQFNFYIEHIPRTLNSFADYWSKVHCQHVIDHFSPGGTMTARMNSQLALEPTASADDSALTLATPAAEGSLHSLFTHSDNFTVPGIFPERLELLRSVHNSFVGHLGIHATIRRIRALGKAYPRLARDVRLYLKHCPICQKARAVCKDDPVSVTPTHFYEPFACIQLDCLGPFPTDEDGMSYLQALICTCTAFVELVPIKADTGDEAARAINSIIGRYGVPYSFSSDNGPSYTAAVTQELCRFWEADFVFGTPYSSEDQSRVERSHKETLRHLRAICFHAKVYPKWSQYSPVVQRIVNSAYNQSLGTCPMRMLFGSFITSDRGFIVDWEPERLPPTNVTAYLSALDTQLQDILEASMAWRDQEYAKRNRNPGPEQPRTFQPGDYVLIDYPARAPNKLCFPRAGPAIVREREQDSYIVVDLLTHSPQKVHVARLHPFCVAPPVDPLSVAAAENQEWLIDTILEHRYSNDGRPLARNLEFKVRWLGYGAEDDTWEPWKNMRETVQVEDYARRTNFRLPRSRHDRR